MLTVKLDSQKAFAAGRSFMLGAPATATAGFLVATIAPLLRMEGYAVSWSPKSKRACAVKAAFRWPLADQDARVSSPIDYRDSPTRPGIREFHSGVDIAAPEGTEVLAAAEGIVMHIGWDPGGFGRYVLVAHGPSVCTLYAHLSVAGHLGPVEAGQVVGRVGHTGRATGPHLHFGVYVTDPDTPLLVDKGGAKVFNRAAAVDPIQLLGKEV